MDLCPGDARDFFECSDRADEVLALRRALLEEFPDRYRVLPRDEGEIIAEALGLLSAWTGREVRHGIGIGAEWEPDWVLLRPAEDGGMRVVAGVVCFPSGWSLPEKLGKPLFAVHAPVPGLNESLGGKIDTFLNRLEPGTLWERENWGLSADGELDHHPARARACLAAESALDATWLRLERQLFARLSGGGLLFGIRVSAHRLDRMCADRPGLGARVARALLTMPTEIASYKGIPEDRSRLIERLASCVA